MIVPGVRFAGVSRGGVVVVSLRFLGVGSWELVLVDLAVGYGWVWRWICGWSWWIANVGGCGGEFMFAGAGVVAGSIVT